MEELEKARAALAEEIKNYSFAGVISFLEQEWFTYQDQREKWELDKREMQRQIDALQQKNQALENVQHDLVKRIKMLEYALVQERYYFCFFELYIEFYHQGSLFRSGYTRTSERAVTRGYT